MGVVLEFLAEEEEGEEEVCAVCPQFAGEGNLAEVGIRPVAAVPVRTAETVLVVAVETVPVAAETVLVVAETVETVLVAVAGIAAVVGTVGTV